MTSSDTTPDTMTDTIGIAPDWAQERGSRTRYLKRLATENIWSILEAGDDDVHPILLTDTLIERIKPRAAAFRALVDAGCACHLLVYLHVSVEDRQSFGLHFSRQTLAILRDLDADIGVDQYVQQDRYIDEHHD